MNILKKHATMCFMVSSAVSLLGNSVASVVLPLILLATTGDAFAAGLLAIICAIPQMVIGVLGGALLDRFNRRDISIISDIISAASIAALPIIDMTVGLNFGWFVLMGIIGSIGDIPGMTARDTLIASVTDHDGVDLQRYMGLSQSLESIVTIIGPAVAAGFVALVGGTSALWLTSAMSLTAALVTCGIPRKVGTPKLADGEGTAAAGGCGEGIAATGERGEEVAGGRAGACTGKPANGFAATCIAAKNSLREGLHALFAEDKILCATVSMLFGLYIVIGGYQGLVLPVHFTETAQPAMLGVMLSVMSGGMFAGSLLYTAFTHKLRKRTWYTVSLLGMLAGLAIMGLLPPAAAMLAGGFVFGVSAGPISALLGYIMLHRIPDEKRGKALGTQNSLSMLTAPAAVFASSIMVEAMGTHIASYVLMAIWAGVTLWAIATPRMRNLDEEL